MCCSEEGIAARMKWEGDVNGVAININRKRRKHGRHLGELKEKGTFFGFHFHYYENRKCKETSFSTATQNVILSGNVANICNYLVWSMKLFIMHHVSVRTSYWIRLMVHLIQHPVFTAANHVPVGIPEVRYENNSNSPLLWFLAAGI